MCVPAPWWPLTAKGKRNANQPRVVVSTRTSGCLRSPPPAPHVPHAPHVRAAALAVHVGAGAGETKSAQRGERGGRAGNTSGTERRDGAAKGQAPAGQRQATNAQLDLAGGGENTRCALPPTCWVATGAHPPDVSRTRRGSPGSKPRLKTDDSKKVSPGSAVAATDRLAE